MPLGERGDPAAVALACLPARIREQWVAERLTAAELLVGVRVVGADPHDLGVEGMEALQVPLKALGLDRAAFGEIARIEIEDQPLPVEVTQACLLYTSPSPRDKRQSRMPSSA